MRGTSVSSRGNLAESKQRLGAKSEILIGNCAKCCVDYRRKSFLRLRPSGCKRPVATQFAGFTHYQRDEAETWEHMAMTRARLIAGDAGLAGAIDEARGKVRQVFLAVVDREGGISHES